MAHRLVIRDGDLRRGHSSLRAAIGEFEAAQDTSNDAATAVGNHGGLAGALRDSASNWSVRRERVLEGLTWLADTLKNTIDAFENVDTEIARNLVDDSTEHSSVTDDSSSTSTDSSHAEAGESSAQSGTTAEAGAPFATVDPDVDAAATDSPLSPVPSAPTSGPSAAPSAASVQAGLDPVLTGPVVTGSTTGASGVRVGDASLEQLATALVAKWTSLGGTEQAIISALALAGVGGLGAAGVSALATGTSKAQAGAAGTSDVAGSQTVSGGAVLGAPAAAAPGSESVPSAPGSGAHAGAKVEASGSVTAVDGGLDRGDGGAGLGAAGEAGTHDLAASDERPAAQPGRRAEAVGTVEAADSASPAVIPEGLPDLAAGGSTAQEQMADVTPLPPLDASSASGTPADAGGNASPPAPLPSLAVEPAGPAPVEVPGALPPLEVGPETAVAAAGAPLAASALQARPAVGGVPMAGGAPVASSLPPLGPAQGSGANTGETEVRERDIRRILNDLKQTADTEERDA